MKQWGVTLCFVLCFCVSIDAQDLKSVKLMECEIGLGVNQAGNFDDTGDFKAKAGLGVNLFFETRMNVNHGAWDVGIQYAMSFFDRDYFARYEEYACRSSVLVVSDYNFMRGRKIVPFIGLGVGMACFDIDTNDYEIVVNNIGEVVSRQRTYRGDSYKDNTYVFCPRVGVEFINRIRLTAEYRAMKKQYSYFGMNLGVVFGGGYIKKHR